MSSRLSGYKRVPHIKIGELKTLHIWRHTSMTEALKQSKRRVWSSTLDRDKAAWSVIGTRPVDGDKERLKLAVDRSDALIEAALEDDPRLARKAQWVRRDEGEHVDVASLANGDDQPFYKRIRQTICPEVNAGEPVRIVISTDDDTIPDGAAAAFIATIRIVQQFVPVEIWWQGAWLNEERTKGFVFHVPLVQGDMDFSRLEYCIADETRDMLSFRVTTAEAVNRIKESWSGCGTRAEYSYLPEMGDEWNDARWSHFVSHNGVNPNGSSISYYAAKWIGLPATYVESSNVEKTQKSALQELPKIEVPVEYKPYVQSASDKAYFERQERQRKLEANKRLEQV